MALSKLVLDGFVRACSVFQELTSVNSTFPVYTTLVMVFCYYYRLFVCVYSHMRLEAHCLLVVILFFFNLCLLQSCLRNVLFILFSDLSCFILSRLRIFEFCLVLCCPLYVVLS